jgi:hypothetical protein
MSNEAIVIITGVILFGPFIGIAFITIFGRENSK